MRQYGEAPPWLAAANTPLVKDCTGLGTGGAGIFTPDSSGFFDVLCTVGTGWDVDGSIVLAFPSTPPTLFVSGDEAFVSLSQSTTGNDVTIAWTGAALGGFIGQTLRIHAEWETSY